MSTAVAQANLDFLTTYLEANRQKYASCLSAVDHNLTIDGVTTTIRFHFVKFDGNGQPKFRDLALALRDHIISYSLSERARRKPVRPDDWVRLTSEAKALFRLAETG